MTARIDQLRHLCINAAMRMIFKLRKVSVGIGWSKRSLAAATRSPPFVERFVGITARGGQRQAGQRGKRL
jgi:hypothetical protein